MRTTARLTQVMELSLILIPLLLVNAPPVEFDRTWFSDPLSTQRHSVLQVAALLWAMHPLLCAGTVPYTAGLIALLRAYSTQPSRALCLVDVLSDILSDWPSLHRQHDASEFYTYICTRLCPSLVHGAWACRAMQGDIADMIDQGHSANAIALPTSHRCTLDFMVHKWAQQGDRCALVWAPRILCLSAPRFQANGAGYDKSRVALQLLQPEVSFPIFVSSGLRTTSQRYRLRACVVHLGSSMFEGHYKVILASPGDEWHIKDDNTPARSCSYVEAHTLASSDGYLMLYDRVD